MRTKRNGKPITPAKKKRGGGQPTKYNEDIPYIAYELLEQGLTVAQVAEQLGITTSTWTNWIKAHDEFFVAIKKGIWAHGCKKVQRSLLENACGYEYDEVKTRGICIVQDDGTKKMYVQKPTKVENSKGQLVNSTELVEGTEISVTRKKVAGNVAAQVFYICNRQPEDWKNVAKQVIEGRVDHRHMHNVVDMKRLIETIGEKGIGKLRTIAAQYEEASEPEAPEQSRRDRLFA